MVRPALPRMSEDEFQRQVIQFARLHRWKVAHFRPAMTRGGRWVTPVQADGAGFPDLVMVRGGEVVVAELKVGTNQPTEDQVRWIDAFVGAEVPAFVWYPRDWTDIERVLT